MASSTIPYLLAFAELTNPLHLAQAGGKGGALARLYQRRYPVPDGFVLLPAAFAGDDLKPEAWAQTQAHLARLRPGQTALAVRSSALGEDSAQASFAGEFESVLGVRTAEEVRAAIGQVRQSRHSARAEAYRAAQGLSAAPAIAPGQDLAAAQELAAAQGRAAAQRRAADQEMAVVVQRLVPAELAGVLFTADPLTGDLMHMTGNFVRGLGERLVAGQANAPAFTFDRATGKYSGPPELKPFAGRLFALAARLDRELDAPQDIEWAVAGGRVYVLQARPITTLRGFNPATGELNDTLAGDFLWSNGNAAEIQPDVMTLLSWSIVRDWGAGYAEWWSRYPASGAIGGRLYFNISVQVAPFAAVPGLGLKGALRYVGDWWGRIPPGVTVPLVPFSTAETFLNVLPMTLRSFGKRAEQSRRIPEFVQQAPAWCRALRERVRQAPDNAALAALWAAELKPFYCFGTAMASVANSNLQTQLHAQLRKLVGEADASALVSNLGGAGYLASLGPVVNLARVARGELSREAYLEQYGHRGPHEFDLARPQPGDDPAWLDGQLADLARHPVDVDALLARQRASFQAAWQRLAARYPRRAPQLRRQLAEAARLAQQRETARSEITRVMGVLRAWALRAGERLGVGADVFHLTVEEVVAALRGERSALRHLPARQATFARYAALPPYPPVISGRFDPFQWAADPHRRTDVYDAHAAAAAATPAGSVITGFPGAAGVVEGVVRRLDRAEDGPLLQPGEILVTVTTNVGWTPLFPRAAAIVTDVGAPLSHAAIVARELGRPAVVGCNDATLRLKTGDRVRVNGGQGTVEILAQG